MTMKISEETIHEAGERLAELFASVNGWPGRGDKFIVAGHSSARELAEAGLLKPDMLEEWGLRDSDDRYDILTVHPSTKEKAREMQKKYPHEVVVRRFIYEGPWMDVPDDESV